jgi:DNA-binding NarL/FixJ family response regulator
MRLSGDETLRELIRLRPDLKAILSSGYGRDETLNRYAAYKVASFIQKPYALNQLREIIRAVTGPISTPPTV